MNQFPVFPLSSTSKHRDHRIYSWPYTTTCLNPSTLRLVKKRQKWKKMKNGCVSSSSKNRISESSSKSPIRNDELTLPQESCRKKVRSLSLPDTSEDSLMADFRKSLQSDRRRLSMCLPNKYMTTIPEESFSGSSEESNPPSSIFLCSTFNLVSPLPSLSDALADALTPPKESILLPSHHSTKTADSSAHNSGKALCKSLGDNNQRCGKCISVFRWERNRRKNSDVKISVADTHGKDRSESLTNVTSNEVVTNKTWLTASKEKRPFLHLPIVGRPSWQANSCGNAVTECSLAVGRNSSASDLIKCQNTNSFLSYIFGMAENKFQVLKKSISSWSLSSVNKPKLVTPKFRKPKIKIFSGHKKGRFDVGSSNYTKANSSDSPTLQNSSSVVQNHKKEDEESVDLCNFPNVNDGESSQVSSYLNTESEREISSCSASENSTDSEKGVCSKVSEFNVVVNKESKDSKNTEKGVANSMKFIDDEEEFNKSNESNGANNYVSSFVFSPDECYSWFDAVGGPSENEVFSPDNDDYSNYKASEYFDASETRTLTPSGKSYEDIEIPDIEDIKLQGSVKAREWVKSYDEENSIDDTENTKENTVPVIMPRSWSEIHLENKFEKKSKNEIILNAIENKCNAGMKTVISKLFPKESKKNNEKKSEISPKPEISESEDFKRKESMKKVFGVRGKASLKTTVIDSSFNSNKDSDIHLASAPFALTNTAKSSINNQTESKNSIESLHDHNVENIESLDGIRKEEYFEDETEELMKEIEKYLSDTDYIGESKTESKNKTSSEIIGKENILNNIESNNLENVDCKINEPHILNDKLEGNTTANLEDTGNCSKNIFNNNENTNDEEKGRFNEGEIENKVDICNTYHNDIERNTFEANIEEANLKYNLPCTVANTNDDDDKVPKEEQGRKKSITQLSNTIRTFKQNIFPTEGKDLHKLKDEWKKQKSKLNNFRQKIKEKNSEFMLKTNASLIQIKSINNVNEESTSPDEFSDETKMTKDSNNPTEELELREDLNIIKPALHKTSTHIDIEGYSTINKETKRKKFDQEFTRENGDTVESFHPIIHQAESSSKMEINDNKLTEHSFLKDEDNLYNNENIHPIAHQPEIPSKMETNENTLTEHSFRKDEDNLHSNDNFQPIVHEPESSSKMDIDENRLIEHSIRRDENNLNNNDNFHSTTEIFHSKEDINFSNVIDKNELYSNVNKKSKVERNVSDENYKNNEQTIFENESETEYNDDPSGNEFIYENESIHNNNMQNYSILPSTYPRMKRSINELNTQVSSSVVKPIPNPRSRKTKYGYSKQSEDDHNPFITVTEYSEQDQNRDLNDPLFPKEQIQVKKAITTESKKPTMISEMSQNESQDKNVNEPVYWEIGNSRTVPVACPRKRKEKAYKESQNLSISDLNNSGDMPEWIQKRPPIPSPRNKKPKSTLSLNQETDTSFTNINESLREINVFGSSYTNLTFDTPKTRNESKWSGEDFYSGKAASIAYGVIGARADQPPALPHRTKKSSLSTLPCTISSREISTPEKPKNDMSNLSSKRNRRKTSPAIPPRLFISPSEISPQQNPLQVIQRNLSYFTKNVVSICEPRPHWTKSEELLADVLFSVNSVMGQDIKNTWAVVSAGGGSPTSVSLGQVRTLLREAFQVSPEELHGILQEVSRREAANVTLTLKVIEACDLRAKTVRGGSNPFVTIQIPGTSQSHRTRTEPETLSPKWLQEFKIKVNNLNRDAVKLEVWHDLDQKVGNQVSAVKDLKSFSRLVKGTTALAQKQEAHLLGTVQILIKDIRENGINGWYPLYKESVSPEPKERGQIHIEAFVTAAEQGITPNEARKSLDGLIAKLIYHHIKAMSNNNTEEGSFQIPWHGQLTAEANAAIAQHAIILGIPPALQSLSWWIVGSRVPSSDAGWQLKHLKVVQNHLTKGIYDEGEEESLSASFIDWIDSALMKLRNLKSNFPPTSGVLAKHQLSSLLSIFHALDSHNESKILLEKKGLNDLKGVVREAVTDYMKVWWTRLLEENLKGETIPENQILKIVTITSEVHNFLCEIGAFYSPSLLKEMNIPYFREMYLLITHKLNPCVRPPLINVYNHLEKFSDVSLQDNDEKKISTLTLEDGTNLWQLYMNMGRLYKLGLELPVEVQMESGIHDYHKWFNKAVKRWVEFTKTKAELMIEKAVKLDDFEPVDEYNNFSTSATDVSGIFIDIQIWWQKLEWPDPENSMILLARILEDICSHGMKYSDLLKQKVEAMFSIQTHSDQLIISKQICTGLNNIERIRDELTRMPQKFNVKSLIGTVKNSQTGGEEASERFKTNINTLIEISSENMETKVTEFIEAVIEKMKSTLHHAVIQACDSSSENTLFTEVLEPSLKLLHKNLSDNNFRRFLHRLWEVLIELFHFNVTRNTDKRKASYFNGVYHILNASAKFFSPCEDVGLTKDETHSPEYVHLMELLECLRLSSENLISKYYFERYEEQRLLNSQSKGEIVVRAFFTKAGKLIVEVIMAKDMQLNNEVGSLTSKHGQFGSQNQNVDSFIKVQAMPSEWFPTVKEMKTKTMRNSDPAVFEDTFEFDLKNDDNGVSSGVLLLTVKDYCYGRSNKFIGESIIPLQELQCIDSSCKHTVPNIYLKVTQPGMECGYSSLRALRLRKGDKVATHFLRKIQSRLPDMRHKSSGASTVSSDEEKPRSKSPRLLQKIIKS